LGRVEENGTNVRPAPPVKINAFIAPVPIPDLQTPPYLTKAQRFLKAEVRFRPKTGRRLPPEQERRPLHRKG